MRIHYSAPLLDFDLTFSNRQSTFSPLTSYLPLPKYFGSEWSYAQYRIPAQSAHISLSAPASKPPTADVVDEEKCIVGWIQGPISDDEHPDQLSATEHQLVALTYTGGWYRLALPTSGTVSNAPNPSPSPPTVISASPPSVTALSMNRPRSSSGSSFSGKPSKGKEPEKDAKESRECVLKEFRRYGRWDGWG